MSSDQLTHSLSKSELRCLYFCKNEKLPLSVHSFSSYRWKEDEPLFQLTFCLINMEVRFKLQHEGFSLLPSGMVVFRWSVKSKIADTVSMAALVWCLTMLFTFCMSAFFHLHLYSFISLEFRCNFHIVFNINDSFWCLFWNKRPHAPSHQMEKIIKMFFSFGSYYNAFILQYHFPLRKKKSIFCSDFFAFFLFNDFAAIPSLIYHITIKM